MRRVALGQAMFESVSCLSFDSFSNIEIFEAVPSQVRSQEGLVSTPQTQRTAVSFVSFHIFHALMSVLPPRRLLGHGETHG